jgi:hypothetical protein
MSPKSLAGPSGRRRLKWEVEEIKQAALEEAEAEFFATGTGASLRRLHYRIFSRHDTTYHNTKDDYNSLSEWLRDMRLSGELPWDWMTDVTREPHQWARYSNLGDYLYGIEHGYGRDVWPDQPRYVEVWCEKEALAAQFKTVLARYAVPLNIGRGFGSWTAIKDTAERYQEEDKEVVLLAFSDFDPSGVFMIDDLRERLAHPELPGGGVRPRIIRCALTYEDAQRLPPAVVKDSDPRTPDFVARYGDIAVELDALDIADLRERIEGAVEGYMDLEALEHTKAAQRQERGRLHDLISELREGVEEDEE